MSDNDSKIELTDSGKAENSATPVKKSSLWGRLGKSNTEASVSSRLAIYGTKKGKDADVDKQTEQSQQAGSIWNAVLTADAATIDKLVRERPSVVDERGPVGETPIHLLFLYNSPAHQAIAIDLLKRFPHIVTHAYEGALYKGETCLHLAIVHKEPHLVKLLLDMNKELLKMSATGIFFALAKNPGGKDGDCYYGEYPLAFAACTKNKPMVDFLLLQGADLFMQDSNQNTLLHVLVRMKFKDMYEFVDAKAKQLRGEWEAKGRVGKEVPILSKMRNKDGLTPLTLAATMGQLEEEVVRGEESMFSWIIEQQKKIQWTYGPVSCTLYPLDELDSLSEVDGAKQPSCLEIIVKNKHFPLLMTEKVVRLLDKKWEMYARARFRQRFYFTLFYFFVLSVAVVLRVPVGSTFHRADYDDVTYSSGIFRIVCEAFVLLGVLFKGFRETRELLGQGPREYFGQSGSAFLENFLSFLFVWTIVIVVILRCAESSAEDFFLMLAVLLIGMYMLALLLGFRLTGPYIIMISKMLANDVAKFLIIFAFILWSYSTATYVMVDVGYRNDEYLSTGDEPAPFGAWWVRLQLLGLSTMGQVSFDDFNEDISPDYRPISSLLYLSYLINVTILLLNLLIAMMGNTMNSVADRANEEWHLAYAQIIMSIEGEMTDSDRASESIKYWTNIGKERFLQIQGPYLLSYYDADGKDGEKPSRGLQLDANGDGVVSRAELKAFMENTLMSGIADQQRRLLREALESRGGAHTLEPPTRLGPQS